MNRQPLLLYTSLALLTFTLTGRALEPVAAKDGAYRYLSNFSDTLDLIRKNYVDEVKLDRLLEGAYRGLLDELDPESYYLDPKTLSRFRSRRPEGAADTGIDVSKRHGYAVVVSVLPGSPADGKLATGDYVRIIDGQSTRELSVFELREKLAGPAGSKVTMKVVRREDFDSSVLTLERAKIAPRPPEEQSPADGIKSLRLARVDEAGIQAIAAKVKAMGEVKGLVLDLRGTSRGELVLGTRLADLFVDEGTLLRIEGKTSEGTVKKALHALSAAAVTAPGEGLARTGYRYEVQARKDDTVYRGPLVILTDGGTAGAAEVAAAALRDAGRASVVGSKSFGRASLQDLIPMEDGSALNLTIARILRADGSALLGKGLEPDEVIEASRSAGADPALERAVETLTAGHAREKKAA